MTKAWQKHKKLLHDLYISEKYKLKQVMEIMANKHNFIACRRTYMKMFGRWGYRKNRKSQTTRREDVSSRGMNAHLSSAAELPHEPLEVASDTQLITCETNADNPTYKINEATVESRIDYQATPSASSPLDNFRDSDDLNKYVKLVEGALLLNEIKKKALLSGNPDPHIPAMSDYQQSLGKIFSDDPAAV
ncbi:hypothetical protein L873DRAFT_1666782 [Choiromyces venosus 120613-1]|uniref:Clr5 domain-containing protein n=1 Tax=Choiromyces venosus 120613-1 TaxID=1336337 RepID=A0A3N4K224_9PEZI|nr:hypothetical protein L873DRAFT_1666782 [Choiromyces venosus 120613-1]